TASSWGGLGPATAAGGEPGVPCRPMAVGGGTVDGAGVLPSPAAINSKLPAKPTVTIPPKSHRATFIFTQRAVCITPCANFAPMADPPVAGKAATDDATATGAAEACCVARASMSTPTLAMTPLAVKI